MKIKHVTLMLLVLALIPFAVMAQDTTPEPEDMEPTINCMTENAFGTVLAENEEYALDLLCQPTLNETIEVQPGENIIVTVDLTTYREAFETDRVTFDIHFAMDRANINVREADAMQGVQITDAARALESVEITTSAETYTFVVENQGFRSAVFDLSLRLVD
ncbi:MAG: hypothetical protein GYB67_03395 [Chloroflexi bacterium]|nr:hypothetical protein [Chloroflexota bacterium]